MVLSGIYDGEIEAFHDFAARTGMEVRFLELLPSGPARGLYANHFHSVDRLLERLERHAGFLLDLPSAADSTAFRKQSSAGATLGFVAGQSRPFCGSCSRLRLSSRGELHPCLFREESIPLRGLEPNEVRDRIRGALALKPALRGAETPESLGKIGG